MTQEKLTLEDCLKYPKARLIEKAEKEYPLKFNGIIELLSYDFSGSENIYVEHFCLALRSIDQLTNEEKEYMSNFLSITYREVDKYLNGQEMLNFAFKESLHIADYLREINVCIEPEWFNNGKAVKI